MTDAAVAPHNHNQHADLDADDTKKIILINAPWAQLSLNVLETFVGLRPLSTGAGRATQMFVRHSLWFLTVAHFTFYAPSSVGTGESNVDNAYNTIITFVLISSMTSLTSRSAIPNKRRRLELYESRALLTAARIVKTYDDETQSLALFPKSLVVLIALFAAAMAVVSFRSIMAFILWGLSRSSTTEKEFIALESVVLSSTIAKKMSLFEVIVLVVIDSVASFAFIPFLVFGGLSVLYSFRWLTAGEKMVLWWSYGVTDALGKERCRAIDEEKGQLITRRTAVNSQLSKLHDEVTMAIREMNYVLAAPLGTFLVALVMMASSTVVAALADGIPFTAQSIIFLPLTLGLALGLLFYLARVGDRYRACAATLASPQTLTALGEHFGGASDAYLAYLKSLDLGFKIHTTTVTSSLAAGTLGSLFLGALFAFGPSISDAALS